MKYPKHIWDQLRNLTPEELICALEKDGAVLDTIKGAMHVYRYPDGRRPTVHYHKSTYGPNLLKAPLQDIGWTEDDLRRLKLVK